MNIGLVISAANLSGAEKRAWNLATMLSNAGHDVVLYASATIAGLYGRRFPTPPFRICVHRNATPSYVSNARSFVKRYIPAAFGATSNMYAMVKPSRALDLSSLAGSRNIEIFHSFLDSDVFDSQGRPLILEVAGPTSADRMAGWPLCKIQNFAAYNAVSPSVLRRCMGLGHGKRLFCPSLALCLPSEGARWQDKRNVVTFAHRFIPRKNATLFAKVAKSFLQCQPEWVVHMFGSGEQEALVKMTLRDEISSGRAVVRYNPVLHEALMYSKIFVSINEIDNYPSQSVLEAMDCGNAILVSDRGSTVEKFFSDNGLVVEPSFDSVLSGLVNLSNCEDLEALGQRSRNALAQRFDPNEYVRQIVQMYELVLDRGIIVD